jgi:YD repeat-containing protein
MINFQKFTDSNNVVYYQMLDFTDSGGNVYTLLYDNAKRLVHVTEPAGRWLQINL